MFLFYNCTRITSVTLTISKSCLGAITFIAYLSRHNPSSIRVNQDTAHLALNMPHRATSVAIQQTINPCSKCHTGTQA